MLAKEINHFPKHISFWAFIKQIGIKQECMLKKNKGQAGIAMEQC